MKKVITLMMTMMLLLMVSACQKEEVVPSESPLTLTEEPVIEEEPSMRIGFGSSTYVAPYDATSLEEGKIADGRIQVETAIATVVVNGDNRIVLAYFDDIANEIWFNNQGQILTSSRVKEWPTMKEMDDGYREQLERFEELAIGSTIDEFKRKIQEIDEKNEEFTDIHIEEYIRALDNAGVSLRKVNGIQSVGFGTVTRYEMSGADEENSGEVTVSSTMAVLSTNESGVVTEVFLDEARNTASFDNKGKVITTVYDTRTKMEKGSTHKVKEVSSEDKEYFEHISDLESKILGKSLEDVLTLEESEDLADFPIELGDIFYAISKATNNMRAWY